MAVLVLLVVVVVVLVVLTVAVRSTGPGRRSEGRGADPEPLPGAPFRPLVNARRGTSFMFVVVLGEAEDHNPLFSFSWEEELLVPEARRRGRDDGIPEAAVEEIPWWL
jgi:hypothetical protein